MGNLALGPPVPDAPRLYRVKEDDSIRGMLACPPFQGRADPEPDLLTVIRRSQVAHAWGLGSGIRLFDVTRDGPSQEMKKTGEGDPSWVPSLLLSYELADGSNRVLTKLARYQNVKVTVHDASTMRKLFALKFEEATGVFPGAVTIVHDSRHPSPIIAVLASNAPPPIEPMQDGAVESIEIFTPDEIVEQVGRPRTRGPEVLSFPAIDAQLLYAAPGLLVCAISGYHSKALGGSDPPLPGRSSPRELS
jgi:hypothetical protein